MKSPTWISLDTVQCDCVHHAEHKGHRWRLKPLPLHWSNEQRYAVVRYGLMQLTSCCPASGEILAYDPAVQPIENRAWTLRHTASRMAADEIAYAVAE